MCTTFFRSLSALVLFMSSCLTSSRPLRASGILRALRTLVSCLTCCQALRTLRVLAPHTPLCFTFLIFPCTLRVIVPCVSYGACLPLWSYSIEEDYKISLQILLGLTSLRFISICTFEQFHKLVPVTIRLKIKTVFIMIYHNLITSKTNILVIW